jgi:thiol-disulfide isomerase/thioredoxin
MARLTLIVLLLAGSAFAATARTSGPVPEHAGHLGVGRLIPDQAFVDLTGKTRRLGELSAQQGLVIAMSSSTCPISKRILPSLAALEKDLAAQGIALLVVNAMAGEKPVEIREQLKSAGLTSPYCHDVGGALARALGASHPALSRRLGRPIRRRLQP